MRKMYYLRIAEKELALQEDEKGYEAIKAKEEKKRHEIESVKLQAQKDSQERIVLQRKLN